MQFRFAGPEERVSQDVVRVYVPVDLNPGFILDSLEEIQCRYGLATWRNASNCYVEVSRMLEYLELYDQAMCARQNIRQPSPQTAKLVQDILDVLENWDSSDDSFPYVIVDQLREKYGLEPKKW